MVCIVSVAQYPTIKTIKEAIAKGESISIEDPSLFNPRFFTTNDMGIGEKVVVTNHPKRSYFVTIQKQVDGVLKVY